MEVACEMRTARIQREAEGYLELDMPRQALQTLQRLGDPMQFDAESLYLWGEGLRAMERYFEALLPLQRAARLAPDDIRVRIALGWCYKRIGRLDLAICSLEKALNCKPDDALLDYNLACYLSLAGQRRRALRHLARALAAEPLLRELVGTEADFNPIRSDPEFLSLCGKEVVSG
jgi:Flp pilus assembly protein TadD